MRLLALLVLLSARVWGAELTCVTWNMEWFPSGKKDLRLPEVEPGRITTAAGMLGKISPHILFIEEIRDQEACEALARAMDDHTRVAVCSAFTDDAHVPTFQQCAILVRTDGRTPAVQVVSSGFERWKRKGKLVPSRGYAYAVLSVGQVTLSCYCVHLKANRSNTFKGQQQDIYNREVAIEQLLVAIKERPADNVIIAGDFNSNLDDDAWVSEASLRRLDENGYSHCFKGVPLNERVTIPAKGGYPDVTFDYLFFKGLRLKAPGRVMTGAPISDHNAVVATLYDEH